MREMILAFLLWWFAQSVASNGASAALVEENFLPQENTIGAVVCDSDHDGFVEVAFMLSNDPKSSQLPTVLIAEQDPSGRWVEKWRSGEYFRGKEFFGADAPLIQAADIDGDGRIELIVATTSEQSLSESVPGKVYVISSPQNDSWQIKPLITDVSGIITAMYVRSSAGGRPCQIALATAKYVSAQATPRYRGGIHVARARPDGTFAAALVIDSIAEPSGSPYAGFTGLWMGDADNDSLGEVFFGSGADFVDWHAAKSSPQLFVYEESAPGGSYAKKFSGLNYNAAGFPGFWDFAMIESADIDSDGCNEILIVDEDRDSLMIFQIGANDSWATMNDPLAYEFRYQLLDKLPRCLKSFDMDGDGSNEIFIGGRQAPYLEILQAVGKDTYVTNAIPALRGPIEQISMCRTDPPALPVVACAVKNQGVSILRRSRDQLDLSGPGSFGDIRIGETVTRSVWVTNLGNVSVTVIGLDVPLGFAASFPEGPLPTTLLPNTPAEIAIRFEPTAPGVFSGMLGLRWMTNIASTNVASIYLSGTGITNVHFQDDFDGGLAVGWIPFGGGAVVRESRLQTTGLSNEGGGVARLGGIIPPVRFAFDYATDNPNQGWMIALGAPDAQKPLQNAALVIGQYSGQRKVWRSVQSGSSERVFGFFPGNDPAAGGILEGGIAFDAKPTHIEVDINEDWGGEIRISYHTGPVTVLLPALKADLVRVRSAKSYFGIGNASFTGQHFFDNFSLHSIDPPRLYIAMNSDMALLSWDTIDIGFKVQSSVNLRAWNDISAKPLATGSKWSVTVPLDQLKNFYRLNRTGNSGSAGTVSSPRATNVQQHLSGTVP